MKNTGIVYHSTERTPTVLAELAGLLPPLSGEQLAALKQSLEARAAEKYPIRTQLPYAPGEGERDREHDRAFLI